MARGFPPDIFRQIPNGEVDWVGRLVAEQSELSFISCDNERYDSGAGMVFLDFFLYFIM